MHDTISLDHIPKWLDSFYEQARITHISLPDYVIKVSAAKIPARRSRRRSAVLGPRKLDPVLALPVEGVGIETDVFPTVASSASTLRTFRYKGKGDGLQVQASDSSPLMPKLNKQSFHQHVNINNFVLTEVVTHLNGCSYDSSLRIDQIDGHSVARSRISLPRIHSPIEC